MNGVIEGSFWVFSVFNKYRLFLIEIWLPFFFSSDMIILFASSFKCTSYDRKCLISWRCFPNSCLFSDYFGVLKVAMFLFWKVRPKRGDLRLSWMEGEGVFQGRFIPYLFIFFICYNYNSNFFYQTKNRNKCYLIEEIKRMFCGGWKYSFPNSPCFPLKSTFWSTKNRMYARMRCSFPEANL